MDPLKFFKMPMGNLLKKSDLDAIAREISLTGIPYHIDQLVVFIIKNRLLEIRVAEESFRKELIEEKIIDFVYHPTKKFDVDSILLFPNEENVIGQVSSMISTSNSSLGEYETLEVKFENGRKKRYVSNVTFLPGYTDDYFDLENQERHLESVLKAFGTKIIELLYTSLSEYHQFILIGKYCFLKELLGDLLHTSEESFFDEITKHINYQSPSINKELSAQSISKICYGILASQNLRNITKAYNLIELISNIVPRDTLLDFYQILKQKEDLGIEVFIREVSNLIKNGDYSHAISLYPGNEEYYPKDRLLSSLLEKYNFLEADEYANLFGWSNNEWYLTTKSQYVQTFFKEKYGFQLNNEQSIAISQTANNLLVRARAGSGKTRVISAKVSYIINNERVSPDQILVLAFNKKAANELQSRIGNEFGHRDFLNAMTFHSLANSLVPLDKKLFRIHNQQNTHRNSSEIPTQDQFIKKIIACLLKREDIIAKLYSFFNKEIMEFQKRGFDLKEDDYYQYKRNFPQDCLDGVKVGNVIEKYIADYFFEHDFEYKYEYNKKGFFINKINYSPLFYFTHKVDDQESEFIIEYWKDEDEQKNVHRPFILRRYKENEITVIEFFQKDIDYLTRSEFEEYFKKKLREYGISKTKLSQSILEKRLIDNQKIKDRLVDMFKQFIQRIKKLSISPEKLRELLEVYTPNCEKEEVFLNLAYEVYCLYELEKANEHIMDYDDLLLISIEKLKTNFISFPLESVRRKTLNINSIRWVLIDEFQDFSKLFNDLILEIRKRNPSSRILCVGDDWQAINGFAGSDLKYFNNFAKNVETTREVNLLTNHRSLSNIVNLGNRFMQGFGITAKALPEKHGGEAFLFFADDVWLYLKNHEQKKDERSENDFYFFETNKSTRNRNYKVNPSRYLKLCYQIITDQENLGKKIVILSRTKRIAGESLNSFEKKLNLWIQDFNIAGNAVDFKNIELNTIHSYKGLEADIVILTEVTKKYFPLIHPDSVLYNILGKTLEDSIEEEKRLFYVAITRAKSKIYFLTEKLSISSYLSKDLKLFTSDPQDHFTSF